MQHYFQPDINSQHDQIPGIYIIHENEEWVEPLWKELDAMGVPYYNWNVKEGGFDLSSVPPEGIFYNRMSASSHTRGNRFSVELTIPLIQWLQSHGRTVINGDQTVQTEVNKTLQYLKLNRHGLKTPRTYIANNVELLLEQATLYRETPFIVKPNRGGKGLGVQKFNGYESLKNSMQDSKIINLETLDGIYLLQDYIQPVDQRIIRMEFVGGKFYYAVRVDTSNGFELCPADACAVDDAFCPTPGVSDKMFEIIQKYDNPDIPALEDFLSQERIDIAGIEYVTDANGQRFYYDINTNTNYNSEAEADTAGQWKGMRRIAEYLSGKLQPALV